MTPGTVNGLYLIGTLAIVMACYAAWPVCLYLKGPCSMPAPQAILDALTNVQAKKDADDAALADVSAKQTALTQAQSDLATSTSTQQQTDAALGASLTQLQQLIGVYYQPGGTLPPPAPAPVTPPATPPTS